MSEAKFTPGPWQYRPNRFDDWGTVRAGEDFICQAKHPHYAEEVLAEHRRLETDPWEANARLIAAAPDLYEALYRIVDSVARCESGDVCQTSDFDDARAALAKARGEA